jgi:hypothetical protein
MPNINGVAVSWGVPDFGIVESIVGSMIAQDFDNENTDAPETIKDRVGTTVSEIYPDPGKLFNLNFFTKGTGIADAKTQSKLPLIGALVTVSFTQANYAGVTTGLTWSVKSAKASGTNTSAIKISLGLEHKPSITTAATA